PRSSLSSHATTPRPRAPPMAAAARTVAVVLCTPPLGLAKAITRGVCRLRRRIATARSAGLPGVGTMPKGATGAAGPGWAAGGAAAGNGAGYAAGCAGPGPYAGAVLGLAGAGGYGAAAGYGAPPGYWVVAGGAAGYWPLG